MATDSLTLTFAALADPTRRAILQRLAAGDAVVKDLALPFAMSSPAVSKHLRVLERAGLVEQGRQAQWRPRRLRAEPLAEAAGWLQAYRPFWEERFDRLDAVVRKLKATRSARPSAPPRPAAKAPARAGRKPSPTHAPSKHRA
ncbi:MAG TPA: metalloregulator ArsR/SmtB family transcription factor [Caldimonas sp.]|nr:metalloregulator ArsR/SmtB family transcription factor [Caldimonas sp.]HEX2539656.1 metalloregulator ArsR/SmtB family transcription factor [Caldimonas sp.]